MNKIHIIAGFIVGLAISLLFGGTMTAQTNDSTPDTAATATAPIQEADLYGLWLLLNESNGAELTSLDVTKMLPDHTGMDISYLKMDDGETVKMQRSFTWQFDVKTQRITQQNSAMMLGDEVILPAGETSARLNLRRLNDEQILFISDESGAGDAGEENGDNAGFIAYIKAPDSVTLP